MMRSTFTASIALLTCVSLLSGCLGYRSRIDPNAARFEEHSTVPLQSAKRLLLTMSFRHAGVPEEQQMKRADTLRDRAILAFTESGRFSAVGTDLADPDLELVLNIEENENYNKAAVLISGLTLTAIPVTARVDLKASGEVYSSGGEKIADVAVDQSMRAWIGLLLFPAIPSLFIAGERFDEDVFRSVLVQMKDQNAF